MLKAIVVCLTIAVGSLISLLSIGYTTPEDVEQWVTVSTERINTYLLHEFGMWVTHQSAPLVSAALTLAGCVIYTLLFRKRVEGDNAVKVSPNTYEHIVNYQFPKINEPYQSEESESVKRAKARQLKTQLISDKLALQAKQKHIENSLSEAQETEERTKRRLELAKRHYEETQYEYKRASNELENLKTEHKKNDRELQSINEEIQKLDGQV